MGHNYNEQFRGKQIALQLQQLKGELSRLEHECKQTDDSFSISVMYNYVVIGGKLIIGTTPMCKSPEIEKRIKQIIQQVLRK